MRRAHTPERLKPTTIIGPGLGPPTRIFISYRRQDTAAAAAHLHDSLARRFGRDKVFRDLTTIKAGQDFVAVIDQAIRTTSVFITLIGRRWLTIIGRNKRRRLDDLKDMVRVEIEAALRHKITVIPLLVDGATMPQRKDLPKSIAALSTRNAYTLPWHEGIVRLGQRIIQVERERTRRDAVVLANRKRLELTKGPKFTLSRWGSNTGAASLNVVTKAMEISLARQGQRVLLSSQDLNRSLEKVAPNLNPRLEGFLIADLLYVIDFVGIKARDSNDRYVARSYPLNAFKSLSDHLTLGRPVLASITIFSMAGLKKVLHYLDLSMSSKMTRYEGLSSALSLHGILRNST